MYEILTARLDESYTHMETGVQIQQASLVQFCVLPAEECLHQGGAICADCAPGWQYDYDFGDEFPFDRIDCRPTIVDLITAGKLGVGDTLTGGPEASASAIVTTEGLMLGDGRIYANPSAAANAAQAEADESPHDEHAETEPARWPQVWDVQQLAYPASAAADTVIVIAITAPDRRHAIAQAITWIQGHTRAGEDWSALALDRIGPRRWTVALTTPENSATGPARCTR